MDGSVSKNKTPVFKIIIVIVVLISIAGYIYSIQKKSSDVKRVQVSNVENSKEEARRLADQISKLVLVDTAIIPDVVTITDAETMIKQQPVFKGAINGDKILVYIKEKRAIVYSPSRNIVVNILPVTMQKQPIDSTAQATTTPQKTATSTKMKR